MPLTFGPFTFEPESGRLAKHGQRIKLQPKSAALLARLLEAPGAVVSRAEIQKRLWPDGTFVDFETGIRVAMKKLRDALSDSAETPSYVQTVPGAGYRFIGTIEQPAAEAGPAISAEAPRPRLLWWGIAFAAALAAVAVWVAAARHRPGFQQRDWVVIAKFDNRTQDTLLDWTLEYALERELGQSPHVSVAARDRVEEVLALMRQDSKSVLDERLARQVAVRDGGIKAVIGGRVERLGGKYVVTVRLVDPKTGEALGVFEATGRQDELPAGMRTISGRVRRALGETAAVERSDDPQVYRVTTPSLGALRRFSAGTALLNNGYQWAAAAGLFEEATKEDPDFATAHIYAARCYSNLEQPEKAAPHYEAAFRLAGGVSERERLFILGSYYERHGGDDRQALQAYQTLASLYPDHLWGVSNLLGVYRRLGMVDDEARELKRLVRHQPARSKWLLMLWMYHTFTRPDRQEAKQYGDLLRKVEGAEPNLVAGADLDAATERWQKGDVRGAVREIERLSAVGLKRGGTRYVQALLDANLALGRTWAAEEVCRTEAAQEGVLASDCALKLAYARNNRPRGLELLQHSGGPDFKTNWLQDLFLSTLWAGTASVAERCPEGAAPEPMAEGLRLLARDRPGEAAQRLGEVDNLFGVPVKGMRNTSSTLLWLRLARASALDRAGRVEEAIAEIEPFSRPPRTHLSDAWHWPQARAKVAELYRKAGRGSDAARVEEELRRYLAAADPDHPLRVVSHATGR